VSDLSEAVETLAAEILDGVPWNPSDVMGLCDIMSATWGNAGARLTTSALCVYLILQRAPHHHVGSARNRPYVRGLLYWSAGCLKLGTLSRGCQTRGSWDQEYAECDILVCPDFSQAFTNRCVVPLQLIEPLGPDLTLVSEPLCVVVSNTPTSEARVDDHPTPSQTSLLAAFDRLNIEFDRFRTETFQVTESIVSALFAKPLKQVATLQVDNILEMPGTYGPQHRNRRKALVWERAQS
jgi:hypothetical protein